MADSFFNFLQMCVIIDYVGIGITMCIFIEFVQIIFLQINTYIMEKKDLTK